MGCTNVLKNAVGVVGIIVVIGICIIPIIKLGTLMIVYSIGTVICEPIADSKITNILKQISNIFKIFLAILISLATLLLIGIAVVIKISGIG